jgi:hypothetical protein
MVQWFCLVVCSVALGLMFAYMHEMAKLLRRRIEVDERFCNLAEDLNTAVLCVQVDVTNLTQTINSMKNR